jgi:hypothetical protein
MSRALARRARRTTRRSTRLALALTAVGALVLAATVVWRNAYADFTDFVSGGSVPVSTATLSLTDDDAGTALFTATDLRPGAAATRCIVVTSASTAPTVVRVYAGARTTSSLSGALRITVDAGTGGCSGFVSAGSPTTSTLSAFPTTWAGGVAGWATTGTGAESRTYQITYALPTNATSAAQGGTASLALTWEAQT